ncbi:DUF559 domain-containing protein [Methylopila sp. M107]|uniref:endonuclease domain-containing protein n=1 Tax=Methylopila sp. M107 TaxID=1101190 RepID=UPI001FDA0429|nr:DUF559 domain-containing protein [Methylopila sp. M107]
MAQVRQPLLEIAPPSPLTQPSLKGRGLAAALATGAMPGTRKPLTHLSRRLRRDSTDAEKRLWRALRDEPFKSAHFRRQVPLGAVIVDFARHTAKLVVELDGGQHAEESHAARDVTRDAALFARGYRVLRFWNAELSEKFEGVLDTVSRALYDRDQSCAGAAGAPTPDPSPQGGGG